MSRKLFDQSLAWIMGILLASIFVGIALYTVRHFGKLLVDEQLQEILDVDHGDSAKTQVAEKEPSLPDEPADTAGQPIPEGVNVCEAGSEQSPIDVPPASAQLIRGDLSVSFGDGPIYFEPGENHPGFVVGPAVITVLLGNDSYAVERIEVRTPSEHRLDGAQLDGEVIYYARSSDGSRVNLSVWLRVGLEANDFVGRLGLAADGGDEFKFSRPQMFTAFPESRQYFQYRGSMIDPPCDEGVTWLLYKEPVIISSPQLDNLKAWAFHSRRKLQPLGERTVRLSKR